MPRIISGRFKGLRLTVPGGRGTRPTADRVKEAIFSMLVSLPFDFQGARVIDLFAGSGSLGLEALSRGAEAAVFADRDRAALAAIKRNLATAGAGDMAGLIQAGWPCGWERLAGAKPFDLFLLDPPYEETALPLALLKEAANLGLAAPAAVAVWEQAPATLKNRGKAEAAPWEFLTSRSWGQRAAAFFQYNHD